MTPFTSFILLQKKEETQPPPKGVSVVSFLIDGVFLRHFYSADRPKSPEIDDFNLDFYRGIGVRCAFNYYATYPYFLGINQIWR